jgi:hypothetical protein
MTLDSEVACTPIPGLECDVVHSMVKMKQMAETMMPDHGRRIRYQDVKN